MTEGIVNMNRPQFDRGVLCLSFGNSLALIQLSKHENQAKIRRSKSPLPPSRILANSYHCKQYEYGTLSAAIAPYTNENVLM